MTSTEPAGLLPIELFILLLALATGVALVARRLAIPNSVALVLAGPGAGDRRARAPRSTSRRS